MFNTTIGWKKNVRIWLERVFFKIKYFDTNFLGLRTLIVAKKILTPEQLSEFEHQYHQAKMNVTNRKENMSNVVRKLETDLQLLCLTGVEDRLQVKFF